MIYLDGRRCDGVSDDHLGRRGGRRSLIRARASLPPSKCNFRIAVGEKVLAQACKRDFFVGNFASEPIALS